MLRRVQSVVLWLAVAAVAAGAWTPAAALRVALPTRLTDAEFWRLIQEFSEPDGFFRSDNLVSNEDTFQVIIPGLQRELKPGGAYIGVGPDQNFTYIASLRPGVVFLPDVRRGNLQMHLMYKALFEMSADRADFLSRLFSRKRPDGLSATTNAVDLFNAFALTQPDRQLYDQTFQAIQATLVKRGFKPNEPDVRGIEYIFASFYSSGPFLQYSTAPASGRSRYPSFAELQTATDGNGVSRAYLATEENYRVVRAMEQNNLIVPLVANFAGPKTIRAVGAWVRERGAKVTTFYASNVEQYLFQDVLWNQFAENLASLPLDETSVLIRSCFNSCTSPAAPSRVAMLVDTLPGLVRDYKAGLIRGYYDVLSRQR